MQPRANGEPELLQTHRRRREALESDRPGPPRRARRRRQSTPWLQRNALSVAAISILVAFLGLGFGLLQMLNHGEAGPTAAAPSLTLAQTELPAASSTNSNVMQAAAVGPSVQVGVPAGEAASPTGAARQMQTNTKVLQANYTIASGDTLVKIAQRFNTTVERIQAFNPDLADPRALRIGTQLVIPAPL